MYRIGIDVGGTNTDAVLMKGEEIVLSCKKFTTPDVSSGFEAALATILSGFASEVPNPSKLISAVIIGTTHFTNAIIQHKNLNDVAIFRLCGQATLSLPPLVDWPERLRNSFRHFSVLLPGGREIDGSEISPLGERELRKATREAKNKGIDSIVISSVFATVNSDHEKRAKEIITEEYPEAYVTLSHEVGSLGLLERENASILNAALLHLAQRTITKFEDSLKILSLHCPLFLSQNDGTMMTSEKARTLR
eukprot:TRINITY_DN4228_c0_g1_i1.p1 TRINITY_DN4228_c0_g1~~TRINITY_DN4228_c0_g1_i1.p1  ORF type:complete len:268 (+),score=58.27 TRINITY_DN4228_c0_g1_i1:56-805(+)